MRFDKYQNKKARRKHRAPTHRYKVCEFT